MICPRCNKPSLEERERDGITIDVCQSCRGIWLDRGELERLIARANDDSRRDPRMHDNRYRDHDHHDHHDSSHKDHSHGDHHGHGHHHRKRNWLAEIFD